MTADQWFILACGAMFLAIPVGMLCADRHNVHRRRRAADELTALWDGPGYWQDHLGEWHEGEPPWDRCPHGVVGGDVWCHHCDGEPF